MNQRKIIVLDNIRSLHNVGSIFRTADSSGFEKLYLCGMTGTPPDRRIEKVSLGAENFIPWEYCENTLECLEALKKDDYKLLALEQTTKASNVLEVTPPDEDIALILGNEVEGLSAEVLKAADMHLEIPMRGQKGSLNVSVAAGVAMYQLTKS